MTVLEASNKLIEYFVSHDNFELGTDFSKICLVSDTDADKAALLIALEEFAKENFVIKKTIKNKDYWVLYKSLALHNRTVPISLQTAAGVAEVINKYVEEEDKVNPLYVSEQDIVNLTILAKRG